MASSGSKSSADFPALPSSLKASDHEMTDYGHAEATAIPVANTAPTLTPYLGLQGRLSQIWVNRWTVLLLLVLVRMLLATDSLEDKLGSARKEALSACTGVESMGSAMASMPHYMSKGVNELTASGVERAVNGLMSMLTLSVTAVQEIVIFIVNLLTSTYVCLITLVVAGSLRAALEVVQDVGEFLDKALGEIGTELKDGIEGFQNSLNSFTGALNSIPQLFGSDTEIPKLDVNSQLDKLDNLEIPDSFDEGLKKLNDSIPDFAEVQEFTNSVLRRPFEEVKVRGDLVADGLLIGKMTDDASQKLINESMVAFEFDRSVFPVPQKEQLTFCSDDDGINAFFDKLAALARSARRVSIGVLVVLAIVACFPMAYREILRWRKMQERATLLSQGIYDPIDVVQSASRPFSTSLGLKAAARFGSTRRQILARWFVAYATSPAAFFLISLGIAGLFACLCQYILLKTIAKETPGLAKHVGEFAGKVIKILDNSSQQWAVGTNEVIESTNNDLNEKIFGWVNTTTGTVNDTLNAFVDKMSDGLNTTFGGTILHDPIKEVLNCLIGLKIAGIQKGLTWVSDHAHIKFPLLANDTFSLGAAASVASDSKEASDSFLADPGSKATDKITNAVVEMTQKIEKGILEEVFISLFILMAWVILVIIGGTRALVLCFGRDKTRGEGGDDDHYHHHDQHQHHHHHRDLTRDSFYPAAYAHSKGPSSQSSRSTHAYDESNDAEKGRYPGLKSALKVAKAIKGKYDGQDMFGGMRNKF